ncbi:hypothetical protein [Winslowiella toletana]|uniref:hypothetical protein n=1 Tax=Winslowiella toletana TaxID=92490 RepID=UPI0028BEA6AF|nr:hypothetical protein [Winslowiella toletana]WNN43661.1 hypothetical protein RIN69_18590 [Winslowiella toletana]
MNGTIMRDVYSPTLPGRLMLQLLRGRQDPLCCQTTAIIVSKQVLMSQFTVCAAEKSTERGNGHACQWPVGVLS